MKAKITSSATFLPSLPKSRRAQLLESLSGRFDAAVTADMSSEDINKLIWLITKLKPLTKISDLRVRRYADLVGIMKLAKQRVGDQRGTDPLTTLSVDLTNVDEVKRQQGWSDDFARPAKETKPAAPADEDEQRQLPAMWQRPQQQQQQQPRGEDSDPEHRQLKPPGGGRASHPGRQLALTPPPGALRAMGAESAEDSA